MISSPEQQQSIPTSCRTKKPNLTVDITSVNADADNDQKITNNTTTTLTDGHENDPKTPPGIRGHSDIRAPGFAKTPLNAAGGGGLFHDAKNDLLNGGGVGDDNSNNITSPQNNHQSQQQSQQQQPEEVEPLSPLADFITQTDKYGNASTPRTALAISAARKLHPEGPRPLLHVENGHLVDPSSQALLQNSGEEGGGEGEQLEATSGGGEELDACDTLLDSFRMMCCCLLPDEGGDSNNNDGGGQHLSGVAAGAAAAAHARSLNSHHHHVDKSTHSTTSTSSHTNSHSGDTANNNNSSYPIGYSTRGHDAPLLLEEDSALRNNPNNIKLLPEIHYNDTGKKCLVLDLDETLVHSSFRAVGGADFVIPVQIEEIVHFVYVAKRPGVDEFLIEMAKHYEIVVYTASLNKYADVLLDLLDPHRVIRTRLFRESCVFYEGNYVKDLCLLNRDLSQCIIIDNSPASYMFHPENSIDCSSFIDDVTDRELDQIGKFLTGLKDVEDVRGVVNLWRHWPNVDLTKNHRRIGR